MTPAQTYQQPQLPPVILSNDKVLEYLRYPQLAPGAILAHDPSVKLVGIFSNFHRNRKRPVVMDVFGEGFGNVEWLCRLAPSEMYQRIIVPGQGKVIYFRFDETLHTVPYADLAYNAARMPQIHPPKTIDVQTAFSHTLTSKSFFELHQADKVMTTPVIYCSTPATELTDLIMPRTE